MAPPPQSKPKAKPAVTLRTAPGRAEVKVSVVSICGPFSADKIRPANPPTNTPAKRIIPVHRPQSSVSCVTSQAGGKPVSSSTVSKKSQTPTIMLQIESCLKTYSVARGTGSPTQHLIGHSSGLCPLCLAKASGSALKECLIIRPLQHQIQKKTLDSPAPQ